MAALRAFAESSPGTTYPRIRKSRGVKAPVLEPDATPNGACTAFYRYDRAGESLQHPGQTFTYDCPRHYAANATVEETGFVYYGHRYYDPKNGRFINRDPIEESGGVNLYGFCGNDGINRWDLLGHQHSVTLNDQGSFTATAMDPWGNIGTWNFGNKDDADRWGQAWVNHAMSVVGDRCVTDSYLKSLTDSGVPVDCLKDNGYTLSDIMDVDGLNLALLPADVWSGWTIPLTWRNTESGMFDLVHYLHNPREWLESYWSGYSWIDEMDATLQQQIAINLALADYAQQQMRALWARVAAAGTGSLTSSFVGSSNVAMSGVAGNATFTPNGPLQMVAQQGTTTLMQGGAITFANGFTIQGYKNIGGDQRWDYNCHGYSLFGGGVWVQNEDMASLLRMQSALSNPVFSQTSSPSVGDIVVYSVGGTVVHSAVVTAPGQVTMASGTTIFPGNSKTTSVPIGMGWPIPGTTYTYWTPIR